MRTLALSAAAVSLLILSAAPAAHAEKAYIPTSPQTDCTTWTQKLETGVQVIGATPSELATAQSDLSKAKQAMERQQWHSCANAAAAGLKTLRAFVER